TFNRILNCPTYPVPIETMDLEARRIGFEETVRKSSNVADVLANLFDKSFDKEYRKFRGIYFTPFNVAEHTIRSLNIGGGQTLLDAGCGNGVFAVTLLRILGRANANRVLYVGIETDPIMVLSAAILLDLVGAPSSWQILYHNFLLL